MKPLSGLDGAFLNLETPATPMHVGSLHLFEPVKGRRRSFHEDVRALMASRMHLAPIFSRRLAPMPFSFANPVWVEDGEVDLDFHVQRVQVPPPGGQAELEACVAGLHEELMDRSRPLWMLYVLEGLADGQDAYYVKIHHAVLDGAAGAALASTLFDAAPAPGAAKEDGRKPARASERPGTLELAAAAFRHDAAQWVKLARYLPTVVSTLAGMVRRSGERSGKPRPRQPVGFGPRTPLNVTLTPERTFAAASVPLAEAKAIAAAHAATVNDVVLALCAATLRRYLSRSHQIPRRPLVASMPISLREPGNKEYRTQATLSLVSLPAHLGDPIARLHAARDAAGATKSLAKKAKGVIPTDFPSIGVPWIVGTLASLYDRSGVADVIPPIANVVISNVPGPKEPLYAAGARMTAYWPLSIVEHGVGLNVTVMSYAGTLGFGFTAARCAVPDARQLAADLLEAHNELARRTLPPPAPAPVRPRRRAKA